MLQTWDAFKGGRRRRNLAWRTKAGHCFLTREGHRSVGGRKGAEQWFVRLDIVLVGVCPGLPAAQEDCVSPAALAVLVTQAKPVARLPGSSPLCASSQEGGSAPPPAPRPLSGASCGTAGLNSVAAFHNWC